MSDDEKQSGGLGNLLDAKTLLLLVVLGGGNVGQAVMSRVTGIDPVGPPEPLNITSERLNECRQRDDRCHRGLRRYRDELRHCQREAEISESEDFDESEFDDEVADDE